MVSLSGTKGFRAAKSATTTSIFTTVTTAVECYLTGRSLLWGFRLLNHGGFRAGVGGACCLSRRGIGIDLRFQGFLFNGDDDTVVLLVRPISLVEILDGIVTERDRLHRTNTLVNVQPEFDQLGSPVIIRNLKCGVPFARNDIVESILVLESSTCQS